MTQIILKAAGWKEDTEGIADKGMNAGTAVSGSAIGPVFVRMKRNCFSSNPFLGRNRCLFDSQRYFIRPEAVD
jgi:hypothetical protein